MKYNFDEIMDRKKTESVKWAQRPNIPQDALPLWVADMDFRSPIEVIQALQDRVEHGVFGYPRIPEEYHQAIIAWMQNRHQWQIEKSWIVRVPGVVPAMNISVRAFLRPGDKVLIQQPVYTPFMQSIEQNGAQIVNSPLKLNGTRYEIDFEDFEKKAQDPSVKLFFLCNPHNPVGRVWSKEELERLGEICLKHNVLVFSDEIHQDLVYRGATHIPFASLSAELANICMTATAPSKTFNIAGLHAANVIISNKALRQEFMREVNRVSVGSLNVLGIVATTAAYTHGADWLEQAMDYIEGNKDYVMRFIEEQLPMLKVVPPEATYLLWLDCRAVGLDNQELTDFMLHKAGLWLNDGYAYGEEGSGFVRLNIACPRKILEQAMQQLKDAIEHHF